jgi:membrane-associated phospholipid phosphatase
LKPREATLLLPIDRSFVGVPASANRSTARGRWIALALVAGFAALAWLTRGGGTAPGDLALLGDVHRHSSQFMELVAQWVTHIGDVATVGALTLITGGLLAWRDRRRDGIVLVASVVCAGLSAAVFKQLFERQRPHLFAWLVSEGGYSFPSGHATGSMALALAIGVAVQGRPRGRLVALASIAAALAVGASRIELGVHYPSDVLAGWFVAAGTVAVMTWMGRRTSIARCIDRRV